MLSLCWILFFLLPFGSQGQQYNFRNYNVENGLAQSQVYTVLQDSKGYLWMGTRGGGVSRYNGFEFSTFTTREGLSGNFINKIIEDESGTIWIATNDGLSTYNGIAFKKIILSEEKKSLTANDIFLGSDASVYCATNLGVFKISPTGEIQNISEEKLPNTAVISIFEDASQAIWLGTNAGLFQLKNNEVIDFSAQSNYMKNAITIVRQDSKGVYWIGTYGDGLYCYKGGDFFRIDLNHELYRQTIFDIHFKDNEIWLATLSGGVIQYDRKNKTFNAITDKEGLSNNHVRCITKDINETFWFGTSGGGICQYLGKQFTTFDEKSGLSGNYIYSILRDKKNRLWVGNSEKGVSVLTPHGIIKYNADSLFKNVKVKALAEDIDGDIWLGTNGKGVYIFREGQFEVIEELRHAYVKQIKVGKNGHIWIATAGSGIIEVTKRQENFLIEKWTKETGILSDRVTSLHFDKKGNLWYGMDANGVGCLNVKRRNTVHLTKENGDLPSDLIRSLVEDKKGKLWIGTAGGGICGVELYKKREGSTILDQDKGLTSNNIYLLTVDKDGNLFVGSEKGLDFITFNEKGVYTQLKQYGRMDGFTGMETCQNSVWNDNNGSIWFGTINGMSRFDPTQRVQNKQRPILSFSDIKLFYESYNQEQNRILVNGNQVGELVLPHTENHVTFEFLGINLQRPDEVFYKWKLTGFDESYSPPSKERSILYSNLNPGIYSFELMASNKNGDWNGEPLIFNFEIEFAFWQTTWFIVTMIALGLLLLFITYVYFTRRIRAKELLLKQQLELERNFIDIEQKAMRLQMNPHFIFNALNSIQGLIGTGKETEARYYLAKFSRLMRQILDNSRKNEISLEEEVNTLENYLLVEQFCNGNKFEYSISLEDDMEVDFINIPPMLIQPFVENAIKHGMKGFPENKADGKITITFSEKKGYLECVVLDNGVGREKSAELKRESKETYHKSAGLEVTQERLKRISTELETVPLEIIDLKENGEATGTKVILRIPID